MLNISYIDNLAEPLVARQEQINLYVLTKIARRIKEIGELSPSDLHSLEQLMKTGADTQEINRELAKLTNLQNNDIRRIIRESAKASYFNAKPFYDYRELSFIPFEENIQIQNVVAAIVKQTQETFVNLEKSRAFMIRDATGKLTPTPLSTTYQTIVDRAIQASQSGIIDYNTSIRGSIEQLINSGIRSVSYSPASGRIYTQRLDTAVRRTILDGIRAVNQGVQDEVGRQFGADGKEIMVHANSAPDHEPVQGHQFTNEEFDKMQRGEDFEDLQGRNYSGFERAIGTWNCRHFTFSIICGVEKPNYTDEQLEKIKQDNQKGYTFPGGKHLTMYECTQEQRKMETKIRKLKDGQIVAQTAGDEILALKYQDKIKDMLNKYTQFSKDCGLRPRYDKTRVVGYKEIKRKAS